MNQKKLGLVLLLLVGIIACLGGLYAHLTIRGWFESWQPLGKPPEKAVKIFAYPKEQLPFIETSNGETYLCSHSRTGYWEDCWVKVERSQLEIIDSYPCEPGKRFYVSKPPGQVIDMVEFESCDAGLGISGTTRHSFALLEDGSVWTWKHSQIGSAYDYIYILLHIGAGAFLGVLISLGIAAIVAIVDYRNERKIRAAQQRNSDTGQDDELSDKVVQPIPVEEQRKCPNCEAVISQNAEQCSWCGEDI